MKALTTIALTVTLIMMLAINAIANDSIGKPVVKESTSIALPEFVWGSPEDISTEMIEGLKYANIPAPEFVWGSPEDINEKEMDALKASLEIALPEFVWGNPEDVDTASAEALKNAAIAIEFPALCLGRSAGCKCDSINGSEELKKGWQISRRQQPRF